MGNFTLNFQIPLESQQLVMAGGDQDPLGKPFKTASLFQYEDGLFKKDHEPPLPRTDFLLDLDETIVPISAGKRDKINSIFSVNCVYGCTEGSRK